MEDQTSWKGHTFTLLVFTGIVVLCSIFFILGMLVGHSQGLKTAAAAAPEDSLTVDAKPELKEEDPDFTFYEAVKKEQPAVLESTPPPPQPEPPVPTRPRAKSNVVEPPPVTSKPSNVVNYQIGAVRKSADADKLLSAVKKKGFRAFILAPGPTDQNPFFRIQVGPLKDPVEAQDVKKKLESAGYQPILKK